MEKHSLLTQQNQRINYFGKDLWDHQVQPVSNTTLSTKPRHQVPHMQSILSRDGDSTTSTGGPFQCPIILSFSNLWPKLPLAQLKSVCSHPVAGCLGGETAPHLAILSFEVAIESYNVSPYTPLHHLLKSLSVHKSSVRFARQQKQ